MFNRILVPLDGSPLAELVVPYAEELAMAFGSEIIRFADASATSLIAISSHGRSGIAKWLLGSVANKVLNSASKPVLLVKARRSTGA